MRKAVICFVCAGVLAMSAWAHGANPLDVLQSDASREEKMDACRTLSVYGGQDAVPALAALLNNPELAHMARYALEPMPYPEVDAALRDALTTVSGALKVGVIDSIRVRKDAGAVAPLSALLSDADDTIVLAAAKALGAIATPEAAKALDDAIGSGDAAPARLQALCEGFLACAENYVIHGLVNEARAQYDRLRALTNAPKHIRSAALRGAILLRRDELGLPLLSETISAGDADDFTAVLRAARELDNPENLAASLAEILPGLPPERKIRVLEVMGEKGGVAAGPAALAEAKEGPVEVRVAALAALTRLGHQPALELITQLAWTEEGELAKAARNALSYFPGDNADKAVLGLLRHKQAEARLAAVELIGQGALDKPAAVLMPVAKEDADGNIRTAALRVLQECAGIDEMPALLGLLEKGAADADKQAAERVLGALVVRQKRMPAGDITIEKALYGDLPDGASSDVTNKVQQLVASNARSIEASNVNFGEPAPGIVKKLLVEYSTSAGHFSKMVQEGQTLELATPETPQVIVDAFLAALQKAPAETKPALLELLGGTGSPKALDAVNNAAATETGAVKEAALRALCDWPVLGALPVVMGLVKDAPDQTLRVLALRGALRLLEQGNLESAEYLGQYAELMGLAANADEKKAVLAGLAKVRHPGAFDAVLREFADESVKAEAVQAAVIIGKNLGQAAREDKDFFNGQDLSGWTSSASYWRVEDGAIVGHSDAPIPRNEFIWSSVEAGDFYMVLSVKLEPNSANAGIQIRSKKVDEHGQALGYQADMGHEVWGRLYHEHGRGKLDWTDAAEQAVKPEEWNRYEILAVGPAIWTAINGTLGVACLDIAKDGERSGLFALQVHGGPPQTVRYRIEKLVHNPKVELEKVSAEELIGALRVPEQ